MEYEIAEYLLKHQDGIQAELSRLSNSAKANPVLTSYFRDAVVNEVIQIVALGLSKNYDEVANVITYEYLVKLLGQEFCEKI